MSDDSTVGDRIRRLRKLRGMTQDDLRRGAGLSLRAVKDVENGTYPTTRRETLHRIAVALEVHTSDLTVPGRRESEQVPAAAWLEVGNALHGRADEPEPGKHEPTAGDVLAGAAALKPVGESHEYSRAELLLPGLLRDAMSLGDDTASRTARSRALTAAAWMLNMTRQFDDAWTAAQLAVESAPGLSDTMDAVSMMCWCLLRQGRSGEAGALAADWADRAEPRFSRATPGELAAYGKVLLYMANAMTTDNQPAEARDALSLAQAAAVRIGRDVPVGAATTARFGPATVTVIAAEAAVLSWNPDRALRLAEQVRGSLGGIGPSSQLRHRLDIASAHAMRREYGDATEVMLAILRQAPEWLANQKYARNILEDIIRRRRGPLTEELRDLAGAARLPI